MFSCVLLQAVETQIEVQEALRDADRLRADNATLEEFLLEVIFCCFAGTSPGRKDSVCPCIRAKPVPASCHQFIHARTPLVCASFLFWRTLWCTRKGKALALASCVFR